MDTIEVETIEVSRQENIRPDRILGARRSDGAKTKKGQKGGMFTSPSEESCAEASLG
jgi:hypothetical protein